MSDDVEQRFREELQRLLDAHAELAPVQFRDGDRVVALSVEDGVPRVAQIFPPDSLKQGLPPLTQLHGQPAYHIYNLLQSLRCLDEDTLREGTASLLAAATLEEVSEVQLEPPSIPPAPELVAASTQGMAHHLEVLQDRNRQLLAASPNLEPLVLRTARGAAEIRVSNGEMQIRPSQQPGLPYAEACNTPQVRLYLLHQTIQGLQAALYGDTKPLMVIPPGQRNKTEEHLLGLLQTIETEPIAVPIRRSKKTLYVCGQKREIIYSSLRVQAVGEKLCVEENTQPVPVGHSLIEYRNLPPDLRQLLNAFFAYLSSRASNGNDKH